MVGLSTAPNGHRNYYPQGKSEAQKLREERDRLQMQYEAQAGRATMLERQRDDLKRAHQKMRERVGNGVCPCCDRTFQNFMDHMKTQHPEFGKEQTFKALRDAFGLTVQSVADEVGVSITSIYNYEKGADNVGPYVRQRVEAWVTENTGE